MTRLHWFGGLRYTDRRNMTTHLLAGYPACVAGDKADRLRAEWLTGADVGSLHPESVTCAACRRLLDKPGAIFGNPIRRVTE